MAALAGVNEGAPQEPVNPAPTPAEPAAGALLEAEPAEAVVSETEPAEAGVAGAGPVDAELAGAESADAEVTEAQVTEAQVTEAELGEKPAVAKVAEVEPGEAELAEPELREAKPTRDMSPLAIIGVIFGVMALVAAAVGVLAVATHGFHRKTVVIYRPAAVFALRPGECLDSASGLAFTLVACSKPHDAEVFARFALTGSSWPGSAVVQQEAGNGCADRLSGYLNPQLADAGLAQEYLYPNQSAWQADERTVVCEVRSPTGSLTGSVGRPS